jgi:hypothetical protein
LTEKNTPIIFKGDDLVSRLGPGIISTPEVLVTPLKEIYLISDWDSLMHRYKPEHIRKALYLNNSLAYIKKAISGIEIFDRMYNHPDFKVTTDDKKEGLTIW